MRVSPETGVNHLRASEKGPHVRFWGLPWEGVKVGALCELLAFWRWPALLEVATYPPGGLPGE